MLQTARERARRHRPHILTGIAASAFVLASLAVCSPAFAWEAYKSTNGVVVVRESQDTTAAADVTVYYDYKGGQSWSPSYNPVYSSSYRQLVTFPSFMQGNVDAMEVPLVDGYRFQCVSIAGAGGEFPVIYEPLNVAVKSFTPTATVSIPETSTVDVGSIDGLPPGFVYAAAVLLVLVIGLGLGEVAVKHGGN